ncbi:hypothetical protein ABK040_010771 [Willaertia magna]
MKLMLNFIPLLTLLFFVVGFISCQQTRPSSFDNNPRLINCKVDNNTSLNPYGYQCEDLLDYAELNYFSLQKYEYLYEVDPKPYSYCQNFLSQDIRAFSICSTLFCNPSNYQQLDSYTEKLSSAMSIDSSPLVVKLNSTDKVGPYPFNDLMYFQNLCFVCSAVNNVSQIDRDQFFTNVKENKCKFLKFSEFKGKSEGSSIREKCGNGLGVPFMVPLYPNPNAVDEFIPVQWCLCAGIRRFASTCDSFSYFWIPAIKPVEGISLGIYCIVLIGFIFIIIIPNLFGWIKELKMLKSKQSPAFYKVLLSDFKNMAMFCLFIAIIFRLIDYIIQLASPAASFGIGTTWITYWVLCAYCPALAIWIDALHKTQKNTTETSTILVLLVWIFSGFMIIGAIFVAINWGFFYNNVTAFQVVNDVAFKVIFALILGLSIVQTVGFLVYGLLIYFNLRKMKDVKFYELKFMRFIFLLIVAIFCFVVNMLLGMLEKFGPWYQM